MISRAQKRDGDGLPTTGRWTTNTSKSRERWAHSTAPGKSPRAETKMAGAAAAS